MAPPLDKNRILPKQIIAANGQNRQERPVKNPPFCDFSKPTSARICPLLNDWQRRPEPLQVAEFSQAEILTAAANAYGRDFSPLLATPTLRALPVVLPYILVLAEYIERNFPEHTILVAGRDAEIFYDALRVRAANSTRYFSIKLFPGSCLFWELGDFGSQPAEDRWQYFGNFGLTYEALTTGRKFLLIDSGFQGSIIRYLHRSLELLCGFRLPRKLLNQAVTGSLVSWYPSANNSDWLKALPSLELKAEDLAFIRAALPYPLFTEGATMRGTFPLAAFLQCLPKHHESYINFNPRKMRAEPRHPIPRQEDIEDKVYLNPSVVNAVAAMLWQQITVEYFIKQSGSNSGIGVA